MPYPKNQISVIGAKVREVETRWTQDGKQITTVKAYEYQGQKNDKPEGLFWDLQLWEKTAQFFTDKNPNQGDYISFQGSIIDSSFDGQDGKRITRSIVRVNQIDLLKPRDDSSYVAF